MNTLNARCTGVVSLTNRRKYHPINWGVLISWIGMVLACIFVWAFFVFGIYALCFTP